VESVGLERVARHTAPGSGVYNDRCGNGRNRQSVEEITAGVRNGSIELAGMGAAEMDKVAVQERNEPANVLQYHAPTGLQQDPCQEAEQEA